MTLLLQLLILKGFAFEFSLDTLLPSINKVGNDIKKTLDQFILMTLFLTCHVLPFIIMIVNFSFFWQIVWLTSA